MFDRPPLSEDAAGGDGAAPEPVALDSVALHWQVLVGRDQRPSGVRLELRDRGPSAAVPLSAVLDSVVRGLAGTEEAPPFPHGLVLLAPTTGAMDTAMAQWSAPRNVLLEVPASDMQDETRVRILFESRRQGVRQALRLQERLVSRERLQFFPYLIAPSSAAQWAGIPVLATDSASPAQVQAAFDAGAHAMVGWPLGEPLTRRERELSPSQRAIFTLVRLIQADAEIRALEKVFEAEPLLAYMLLTLANSVAFRRGAPTASLRQAVTSVGYQRLVKWLVLILTVSTKDQRIAPLIFTTLIRGYAMENLWLGTGGDREQADGCFIVGAFSLLDIISGQPLAELMGAAGLPQDVTDALVSGTGPYAPYLRLVRAMESPAEPCEMPQILALDPDTINRSLLRAISAADAMLALI